MTQKAKTILLGVLGFSALLATIGGSIFLARKANAELVYLNVEKTSRGHYRLTFTEMRPTDQELGQPYPLTRCFWRLIEQNIRLQPELWLWSHNRWQKWELTE